MTQGVEGGTLSGTLKDTGGFQDGGVYLAEVCMAQVGVNVSLNPFPLNSPALRRGLSCQSDWWLTPQLEKLRFSEDLGMEEQNEEATDLTQLEKASSTLSEQQGSTTDFDFPFFSMCSFLQTWRSLTELFVMLKPNLNLVYLKENVP